MIIPLTEAWKNKFWRVEKISCSSLKEKLRKVGVDIGTWLMPLEDIEKTLPVRIRLASPQKDLLISPEMTLHMVVHSRDDKKISLAEIPVGSNVHLEGVTGGEELVRDLEELGIVTGIDFKIIRRLPPMSYIASDPQGKRIRVTETMASKILGEMGNEKIQFSMAGRGRKFTVRTLLGSQKTRDEIQALGVTLDQHLILEHVEPCQQTGCKKMKSATDKTPLSEVQSRQECSEKNTSIRLMTKDNMQFYLPESDAKHILLSD